MPARTDEITLVTLFADVHYYFDALDRKPAHDRFEKDSHLYLFHDLAQGRTRLEVANNVNTKGQDSFYGSLDGVQFVYSHKKPLVFSITIPDVAHEVQEEWRIPHFNLRNETKYMYPIRAVDLYLWTPSDAAEFLASLKNVLPQGNLEIRDAPMVEILVAETINPVIQRLEQVAINAPSPVSYSTIIPQAFTLPSPPNLPDPFVSDTRSTAYAPIAAYNPAAPAAPEPIAHREKTPPPIDGAQGTGLTAAALHDDNHTPFAHQHLMPAWQYQPQTPSYLNNQTFSPRVIAPVMGFPPPPPQPPMTTSAPGLIQNGTSIPPPPVQFSGARIPVTTPPQLQSTRISITPPSPGQAPRHQPSTPQQPVPNFAPPPSTAPPVLSETPYTPPHRASPAATSTTPSFSPAHVGTNNGINHDRASPQAYSPYYSHSPAQLLEQQQYDAYAIHASVYRPTPEEAVGWSFGKTQGKQGGVKVDRLEKGVNKWLKRLDKGW